MLRLSLVPLALLGLVACDLDWASGWSDDQDFPMWEEDGYYDNYLRFEGDGIRQQSSLWTPVQGIAFNESGLMGVAGMSSMTCRFRSMSGTIDFDVDPSADSEVVTDGYGDETDITVITTTDMGVQVTQFNDGGGDVLAIYDLPGAIDARYTDAGLVVLQDDAGCHVARPESDDVRFLGATCAGMDAAPDGRVFAIADGTVRVISATGLVSDTGVAANLIAYDPVHNQIYTALRGGDTVSALSTAGREVWAVTLEGRIVTLDALADSGRVLVGLSVGSDGALRVLDGEDGAVIGSAETFEAPEAVWSSPRGDTVAVRTGWNTHLLILD